MQSQSDKRTERERAGAPRIEERTVEETVEQMNSPPTPTPTQAEADALKEGEPASEAMGRANETAEQRREREAREARETPEERAQRQAREKQQQEARERQQRDQRPGQNQPGYQTR